MTNQPNDISIDDAKAALDSIAQASQLAQDSVNPPLLLRVSLALLIGLLPIFGAWSSGSSLWTFVTIITIAITMFIFLGYYWVMKSRGIKLSFKAKNKKELFLNFISGFLTAFFLTVAIELYRDGYTWVPYVAAIGNAVAVLYLMSKYGVSGAKITQGAK